MAAADPDTSGLAQSKAAAPTAGTDEDLVETCRDLVAWFGAEDAQSPAVVDALKALFARLGLPQTALIDILARRAPASQIGAAFRTPGTSPEPDLEAPDALGAEAAADSTFGFDAETYARFTAAFDAECVAERALLNTFVEQALATVQDARTEAEADADAHGGAGARAFCPLEHAELVRGLATAYHEVRETVLASLWDPAARVAAGPAFPHKRITRAIDEAALSSDDVGEFVETSLFTRLAPLFFPAGAQTRRDARLQRAMRRLRGAALDEFFDGARGKLAARGVDPYAIEWGECVARLRAVDDACTPREKLLCLCDCCGFVMRGIARNGRTNDFGADDLIPFLMYVIVKAAPPNITATLTYIELFRPSYKLSSSLPGNCFVNFSVAVYAFESQWVTGSQGPQEPLPNDVSECCHEENSDEAGSVEMAAPSPDSSPSDGSENDGLLSMEEKHVDKSELWLHQYLPLFICAMAFPQDHDENAGQNVFRYDSRIRSALVALTKRKCSSYRGEILVSLCEQSVVRGMILASFQGKLNTTTPQREGHLITSQEMAEGQPKPPAVPDDVQLSQAGSKGGWKRFAKVASTAIVGGGALAVAGIFAAPALLGALTWLGVSTAVGGTALASATFGAVGAGVSAATASSITKKDVIPELRNFTFHWLRTEVSLHTIVFVPGWLCEAPDLEASTDSQSSSFFSRLFTRSRRSSPLLSSDGMSPSERMWELELFRELRRAVGEQGDIACAIWEPQLLLGLGTSLVNSADLLKSGSGSQLKTSWTLLSQRVEITAQLLARVLVEQTKKPITIIGIGLGAQVALQAVSHLDQIVSSLGSSYDPNGIVQNMVLIGSPVDGHGGPESIWTSVRRRVPGRLINCFSGSDLQLRASPARGLLKNIRGSKSRDSSGPQFHELAGLSRACCGLQDVLVENIDVSAIPEKDMALVKLIDYQQSPGTLSAILASTGIFASQTNVPENP